MRRIVYTVALGRKPFAEMAMGLGRSLSLIGDTTPRVIMTDIQGYDWSRYFDKVIHPPKERDGLEKLTALDHTDADTVLAIDCDMIAFKRMDDIFEYCKGMTLGVQGWFVNSGKWHGGDVAETMQRFGKDQLPKFNGGLIYYERTPEAQSLIAKMRDIALDYDKYGFERYRQGKVSEEVTMMLAMMQDSNWSLIPEEMDFQNTASGLIGFPRINIKRGECKYLVRSNKVRFVEPYLFHALSLRHFPVYWRQLDALKRLERYEDRHPQGYTPWWRVRARQAFRTVYRHITKRL